MFASDLDGLRSSSCCGARLMELLKRSVLALPDGGAGPVWAGTRGKFDDVEVEDVRDWAELLEHLRHNGGVLEAIRYHWQVRVLDRGGSSSILDQVSRTSWPARARAPRTDESRRMDAGEIEQERIVEADASCRPARGGGTHRPRTDRTRNNQGQPRGIQAEDPLLGG